uniref:Uncharacterized protein n=1 Tax=Anopheles culicifacies TaxID=139723 RepID=A0A182MEU7_9DIPT
MDNVFHQTDETFYETQYSKGFPNHPSASESNLRPATANDGGSQMKRIMENERMKPKEQQYRERWHQTNRSQNEPVGGQKFLHTVDSLKSIKDITHGAKSKVESNFSNILFPGYDANSNGDHRGGVQIDAIGDANRTAVTYGKRTFSNRSGDCLWKIFNHEQSSTLPLTTGREKNLANLPAAGRRLERCASAPGRRYDTITQEEENQDAGAINKALQYLHKLRAFLSRSGAVQSTRKELQQSVLDATQQSIDWNGVLLKYIGMVGTLDYEVLKPLLRKLSIDPGSYEGFVKFLDMLDSEISLSQFELGKRMQQCTAEEEKGH